MNTKVLSPLARVPALVLFAIVSLLITATSYAQNPWEATADNTLTVADLGAGNSEWVRPWLNGYDVTQYQSLTGDASAFFAAASNTEIFGGHLNLVVDEHGSAWIDISGTGHGDFCTSDCGSQQVWVNVGVWQDIQSLGTFTADPNFEGMQGFTTANQIAAQTSTTITRSRGFEFTPHSWSDDDDSGTDDDD